MPVHACAQILLYYVVLFYIGAWLNIQYSIKCQYKLAVQYQYQYGLILILNMDKNTGLDVVLWIDLVVANKLNC